MRLRAEHLHFAYPGGSPVLTDLSLEVAPGSVTGLFGPNGSGKSTLLRCLNGALTPAAGQVLLEGQSIRDLTPRQRARYFAVVPQDSPAELPFTALEVVMMGRFAQADRWGRETAEDRSSTLAALRRTEALHLAHRPFNQLSGGERQRVLMARALAQETPALLLDEPANHLDLAHQLETYRLARTLAREGRSVLMTCHDLLLAPMFVDHAVLLQAGHIVTSGTPADVFTNEHLRTVFSCNLAVTRLDNQQTLIHMTEGTA